MISRLGWIGLVLIALGVFMVLEIIPLSKPLKALGLCTVFLAFGVLALFKADRLISPTFASSRLNLLILRSLGLIALILSVTGFVGFLGGMLGFW